MNFKPFNRYIRVNPIEQQEEEEQNVAIVLPENYQTPPSVYLMCEVLQLPTDCNFEDLRVGDKIIIERRMLCSVDITEKPVYLVLENYVYGRITDETNTEDT